jgi:hypothetical protein
MIQKIPPNDERHTTTLQHVTEKVHEIIDFLNSMFGSVSSPSDQGARVDEPPVPEAPELPPPPPIKLTGDE